MWFPPSQTRQVVRVKMLILQVLSLEKYEDSYISTAMTEVSLKMPERLRDIICLRYQSVIISVSQQWHRADFPLKTFTS